MTDRAIIRIVNLANTQNYMKSRFFFMPLVISILCSALHSECRAEDMVVGHQTPKKFFSSPKDIEPLNVGETVPSVVLRSVNAQSFNLMDEIISKPTVIIFYRGGWCPYCNKHLGQLASIEPQLLELGFQIIAISPDTTQKLRKSIKKNNLKYTLLSDSKMSAAIEFGVAFKVDDATVSLYKNKYGIDLEADSGKTHHLLPVPSAFVVDKDGIIQFVYVNADYTVRVGSQELIEAAKKAVRDNPS